MLAMRGLLPRRLLRLMPNLKPADTRAPDPSSPRVTCLDRARWQDHPAGGAPLRARGHPNATPKAPQPGGGGGCRRNRAARSAEAAVYVVRGPRVHRGIE